MLNEEEKSKQREILGDLLDDIKKKAKRIEELDEENKRLRKIFK